MHPDPPESLTDRRASARKHPYKWLRQTRTAWTPSVLQSQSARKAPHEPCNCVTANCSSMPIRTAKAPTICSWVLSQPTCCAPAHTSVDNCQAVARTFHWHAIPQMSWSADNHNASACQSQNCGPIIGVDRRTKTGQPAVPRYSNPDEICGGDRLPAYASVPSIKSDGANNLPPCNSIQTTNPPFVQHNNH